jgi:hypothetical protein
VLIHKSFETPAHTMKVLDFVENCLINHIHAYFCRAKRELLQTICLGQNLNEGRSEYPVSEYSTAHASVAKNHTQERIIYVNPAVVLDKSKPPKLVHEVANSAARCAYHFGQRSLRNFGNDFLRLFIVAVPGHQQ